MNMTKMRIAQILAVSALAFGLAACGQKEEPVTAGQKLDKVVEQAAQSMDKAAEQAAESMDKAKEQADKAVEAASDKMDQVMERTEAAAEKAAEGTMNAADDALKMANEASITAKVKAGLVADPAVKGLQIEVSTAGDVVTLSGNVDSDAVKTRALEIAKGVQGVGSVTDNLSVK